MRFSLWRQYGALNSKPIFDAFEAGAKRLGYSVSDNDPDADVDVIWSVLFHGRMRGNQTVWQNAQAKSKPVIVLEVGGIKRNDTWKVGINGINRDAYFGDGGRDSVRADLLGLELKPWTNSGEFILVCGQHDKSLQWQNLPPMSNWVVNTIDQLRKYTNRPIIFRPHPRCRLAHIEKEFDNVFRQDPKYIKDSYDDFDLSFDNIWATVSWSSNPGIHSVINGVPAFVGPSSLAYDVANTDYAEIENPKRPERQQWLNNYAWTEFTADEISLGLPLKRLTSKL